MHIQRIGILLLASAFALGALGGRYLGSPEDAAPVRQLIEQLGRYQEKFGELLEMRERIEGREQALNKEKLRLAGESREAGQDRARVEAGEMSEQELAEKWYSSGRSMRNEQQVEKFKRAAAHLNELIERYNQLARQLSPFLDHRSVHELERLMGQMQELRDRLEEALEQGDFVKAKHIAQHSPIAGEFGYASN